MNHILYSRSALIVIILAATLGRSQATPRQYSQAAGRNEDFATAVKRIREVWVQEFNAGRADKVAALYSDEAVLMHRNGSLHNRLSIQADLERAISASQARNYIMESLHSESSGNLGYDTGIYNEDVRTHAAEGNYLVVLKRIDGEWKIVAHAAVPNPRVK